MPIMVILMENFVSSIHCSDRSFLFVSIDCLSNYFGSSFNKLPFCLKILLENNVRKFFHDDSIVKNIVKPFTQWIKEGGKSNGFVNFFPSRVLMQDYSGVPSIVDIASIKSFLISNGIDAKKINPVIPVDLIVDHSLQVDSYGSRGSFNTNLKKEIKRNLERYKFLKWGQNSISNFRLVPSGVGICHQVNLEFLSTVVSESDGFLHPDSLIGLDSHTTMINGLSVVGWGVGGIEAESAMLGYPIEMKIPDVLGVKLVGKLKETVSATDLVLYITNFLRKEGVVGKFIEFYGDGASTLSIADKATVSNMCPEYGATCAVFCPDKNLLDYLKLTGRSKESIDKVNSYFNVQNFWQTTKNECIFTKKLEIDLGSVKNFMSGPKRPQDIFEIGELKRSFGDTLKQPRIKNDISDFLKDGDIVIAAITSCTNTSNPNSMIGAGLLAKKAFDFGLKTKSWVKTSFAPGSKVVIDYLKKSGLMKYLEKLGFHLVGYGCTTCIGNSGPLGKDIESQIINNKLNVAAVLSGNRNFEGRVNNLVKMNYLASPMLVVVFAILGTINVDLKNDFIGLSHNGEKIFLKDLLPNIEEINQYVSSFVKINSYKKCYKDIFRGNKEWQSIKSEKSPTYPWEKNSQYIKNPDFFEKTLENSNKKNLTLSKGRIIMLLGNSVTTDHISPAGKITKDSSAGEYLFKFGIDEKDFNTYGARRGNHEVMIRGTFANVMLKNNMLGVSKFGANTILHPDGIELPLYDVSKIYKERGVPMVIFAGSEYGTGSSRDWAAKGVFFLGVSFIIAESYERIHKSNLIGMGIVPLEFIELKLSDLNLQGNEIINIAPNGEIGINSIFSCSIERANGSLEKISLCSRIDSEQDLNTIFNGGFLKKITNNVIENF